MNSCVSGQCLYTISFVEGSIYIKLFNWRKMEIQVLSKAFITMTLPVYFDNLNNLFKVNI